MNKIENLPQKISVFPLPNFIIFPNISLPLNIFEPRYIKMIDDSMKANRIIGMVQPRNKNKTPELYSIGCAGRITNFNETGDGRYLIVIRGISRFKILSEINNDKLYRECEVNFDQYSKDMINWKDLEKQSLDQTINTLAMASPFSLAEKQILLETIGINNRKTELQKILNTYIFDSFNNKTIQ